MADSASEQESDTSSVDGGFMSKMSPVVQIEQMQKRIESLHQENRVLKVELETFKLKCKQLQEENKELRQASVTIQARAEQEEEYISNTLLKKIQELKKEKEKLAMNYEQEEEYLTNDLSRKLAQLKQEKLQLESNLAKEQESQVNKLLRRIEKLEADTNRKQSSLEQLRREKVELENALEQEQESLVNRLWRKMEKLEAEKRLLQEKLEQPISEPPSPRDLQTDEGDMAGNLTENIRCLKGEVSKLKGQLTATQTDHKLKMQKFAQEEKHIREENLRLQRKLQMERERREILCRHLSESESSLEMDDERLYNEMTKHQDGSHRAPRPRTVSSPIPVSPGSSRPLSPSLHHHGSAVVAFSPTSPMRGNLVGMHHTTAASAAGFYAGTSPPVGMSYLPAHAAAHTPHGASLPHYVQASHVTKTVRAHGDKFVKPQPPTTHAGGGGGADRSPSSLSQSSSLSSLGDKQQKSPQSPMQVDKRSQSPMQMDRHVTSPHSGSAMSPQHVPAAAATSASSTAPRSHSPMHTDAAKSESKG